MAFEWLKGIFNKKQEVQRERVRLSIEEAAKILSDVQNEGRKKVLSDITSIRTDALRILEKVQKEFGLLLKASPEEPRAQASKQIKDTFAGKSLGIIRSFAKNNVECTSMEEYEAFAGECSKLVSSISISPTEASHMKFFFDEQIKNAAGSIKDFSVSVEMIKGKIREHKNKFINSDEQLRLIEQKQLDMEKISSEAGALEENAEKSSKEAESLLLEIKNVEGLEESKELLRRAEDSAKRREEEVNSQFYTISKVLRKYIHKIATKEESLLIARYLSSPKTAFIEDGNLAIADIIENAMKHFAELELDEKSFEKIRLFPDKLRLTALREELLNAERERQDKQAEMFPLEKMELLNTERKRNAKEMKENSQKMKQEAVNLRNAIEKKQSELEEAKAKLSEELGKLVNKEIIIY
ncbi:MAG: hypothetical protein HYW25_06050 [Candidatus Aenigmarchaeota archaeon]|nr:hypothetical protein [Candidatus Aenigmarchaeota archaeon]